MNPTKKTKILITGGHLTPALAVMSELSKQALSCEFVWVGHKYNQSGNKNTSAEYDTVTEIGIPFYNLNSGKLVRDGSKLNTIINLLKIPLGFIQAFFIVLKQKPRLVISFGGYIALPVVIWSKILGSNVLVHEQTAVTGLTNRILPWFSNKMLVAWESSLKYYPANKTILTGNPIRPEVFNNQPISFALNPNLPVIYITGGNLGSHKINRVVFDLVPELIKICNVIHQTGNNTLTKDFEFGASLNTDPSETTGTYKVFDYVGPDLIGSILNNSNLIIGRSGANTVYEILALGKPALFIPIPWVTHNEQFINASLAQKTGIASILNESELSTETLLTRIKIILSQLNAEKALNGNNSIQQAQSLATSIIKLDAAQHIAQIALTLLK